MSHSLPGTISAGIYLHCTANACAVHEHEDVHELVVPTCLHQQMHDVLMTMLCGG